MKRMLLITAGVLIIAAALLIWDAQLLRNVAQTARDSQSGYEDTITGNMATDSTIGGTTGSSAENAAAQKSEQSQEDYDARTIIRSKPIPVTGNTPEYDIRLTLYEDSDLKTFLRIEYFLDGMSNENEIDEEQLPEIKGILENTSSQQDDINASRIQQLLLNPVYGQLYLLINGGPEGEFAQTSLYRIDLSELAVYKLFNYSAIYGKMVFNRDFSLLAYSFDDPPHLSVFQEDKVLEIFDCKAGNYAVRGNRDADRQPIGLNHSKGYLYDYEFVAWESLNVVRLKQGIRKTTNLDVKTVVTQVLYDVRENNLLSSDGGEWKIASDFEEEAGGTDPEAGGHQDSNNDAHISVKNENDSAVSDPVTVLKTFYTYLQSEGDYENAMRLLDDEFKLTMSMLKQFGVPEISKSDIDLQYDQDSVSLYKDLLKAAKLDTIAKETRIDANTVVITYYQNFGLSPESQVRQLMSAKVVQVNKEYKIILIEDGVL